MLLLLNKPCGVLCQFSRDGSGKPTLKDFVDQPDVYPAGRLDTDSEGLLALTDDGRLQARLSHPRYKLSKTYWAQVEGVPSDEELEPLRNGVQLKDGRTLPAMVRLLDEPELWPREPPIRQRRNSPTGWIELSIREGRNRQVRRMTAAVGYPTLRLVRVGIGTWSLDGLSPGQFRAVPAEDLLAFGPPSTASPRSRGRVRSAGAGRSPQGSRSSRRG